MSSPDDFDTGNLDVSTEDAPTETPSEPPADSSSSDEDSGAFVEVEVEIEGQTVDPIADESADGFDESTDDIDEDEDGWEPPSDTTHENQEPPDEVLGDIVDPRLATVEDSNGVDASIIDPRLVSEEAGEPEAVLPGPTLAELSGQLAAAIEARDFAHDGYQSAIVKLQAAEEAGSHLGVSLADEMARRQETETALRDAQAALLEASMRASNLAGELAATQAALLARERDLAALNSRFIFQIIPAFKAGQKRETRIYVLADDAGDAIRRVEKAGLLTSSEVENITRTSQKLVII
jgi:hypothetical protein